MLRADNIHPSDHEPGRMNGEVVGQCRRNRPVEFMQHRAWLLEELPDGRRIEIGTGNPFAAPFVWQGRANANDDCQLGEFYLRGEGSITVDGIIYPNLLPVGTGPFYHPCGPNW